MKVLGESGQKMTIFLGLQVEPRDSKSKSGNISPLKKTLNRIDFNEKVHGIGPIRAFNV